MDVSHLETFKKDEIIVSEYLLVLFQTRSYSQRNHGFDRSWFKMTAKSKLSVPWFSSREFNFFTANDNLMKNKPFLVFAIGISQ